MLQERTVPQGLRLRNPPTGRTTRVAVGQSDVRARVVAAAPLNPPRGAHHVGSQAVMQHARSLRRDFPSQAAPRHCHRPTALPCLHLLPPYLPPLNRRVGRRAAIIMAAKQGAATPPQRPTRDLSRGLPGTYKLSLGFRIVRVCAAATASTCGLALLWSLCILPMAVLAPWAYVAAELGFAWHARRCWHSYNAQPQDAQPVSPEEAADCFERVLASTQLEQPRVATTGTACGAWLSTWFHGAPVSKLSRSDVQELLAYAIWFSDR